MVRRVTITAAMFFAAFVFPPVIAQSAGPIDEQRERIREHLEKVESKLRTKDVSQISAKERRAREKNLDNLHQYWKRGVFPHNNITSERTPIFIDRAGRECAVAHLMIQSGWEKEAEAIARRENLKRLPNMESREVGKWLEQSGLTAKEATRIQPMYDRKSCATKCPCKLEPVCGKNGTTYLNKCTAECDGEYFSKKEDDFSEGCCSRGDNPFLKDPAFGQPKRDYPPCDRTQQDELSSGVELCNAVAKSANRTAESSSDTDGEKNEASKGQFILVLVILLVSGAAVIHGFRILMSEFLEVD